MAEAVMTLTAAQIRRACALLRWCSPTLAERSGVAYEAITPAWSKDSVEAVSDRALRAVRAALEEAGVRFGFDAQGRPSARAVKVEP